MILAMMAIMKAGASYVPVDPAYPNERVHYMLDDSKAQVTTAAQDEFSFDVVFIVAGDCVGAFSAGFVCCPAFSSRSAH